MPLPMLFGALAVGCKGDGDRDVLSTGASQTAGCPTDPGYTPRVVRLTHGQYDHSVRDVAGVDWTPSDDFLDDPSFAGFDNNAEALQTTDRLARDYQRAAEAIGEWLASDPDAVEALLPCDPGPDREGCVRELARDLGERAYRRPLTGAEVDAYWTLFQAGDGSYETGDAVQQGVALMVEGMFQSPHFLYRLELSEPIEQLEVVPLDGYEVATRLSYLLWNAPPDRALLDAAAAGELATPEGIATQARRLLDDPRVGEVLDDFHRQLLDVHLYEDLTRDPDLFPDFDPDVGPAMAEEALLFARHAFETGGSFADLMTEPAGFVTRGTAPLYDLDPADFDDVPTYTPLDPERRAGLLTLSGFLAANAYYDMDSPIHRGVFVQRNLLCALLPDPPGDADLELPEIDGVTTREIVEQHTAADECAVCHSIINPAGYAFGHYDAVGRWRDTDNGHPVDASGVISTREGDIPFTDGVDLAHKLATHPTARRCYLTQWYRYGYARSETDTDRCTIDELDQRLAQSDYDLRELLVSLTEADTFRFRPVSEGVTP